MSSIYVERAKDSDQEGVVCGFCGKENDFADDIGWFYPVHIKKGETYEELCRRGKVQKPCCKSCWDGAPGRRHVNMFGMGDR